MASLTIPDPGRWTEAVLKLTKLTRDGRIVWTKKSLAPKEQMPSYLQQPEVFEAKYDNQNLRLSRSGSILPIIIQKGGAGYTLEIIDARGEPIGTFPTVDAIADLFQAVQYYQAGVGGFIDRLLSQP